MSEAGYTRVIGGDHAVAEPDAYTRLDHQRRLVEGRDAGNEAGGAIISAFGIVFGILAFIHPFMPEHTIAFPSMKYGTVGIALALVGLAIGGPRDQMGRYAVGIATGGWFLGSVIGVLLSKSIY